MPPPLDATRWSSTTASSSTSTPVMFEPKPVQKPWPPIHVGGESDAALRRAARVGDGWIGITHTLESVRRPVELLTEAPCGGRPGRPPLRGHLGWSGRHPRRHREVGGGRGAPTDRGAVGPLTAKPSKACAASPPRCSTELEDSPPRWRIGQLGGLGNGTGSLMRTRVAAMLLVAALLAACGTRLPDSAFVPARTTGSDDAGAPDLSAAPGLSKQAEVTDDPTVGADQTGTDGAAGGPGPGAAGGHRSRCR